MFISSTSTTAPLPSPQSARLRARLLGDAEWLDDVARTGAGAPRMLEQRILPCPNLWSRQRCLQVVVDMGPLAGALTSEVPGFTAGMLALQPSMARFGEAMLRGCFIAEVIGQLSIELQRSAGAAPAKSTVATVRGRRNEVRMLVACGHDQIALQAFGQALSLVASLCASLCSSSAPRARHQAGDPGNETMRFHGGSNSWQRRRALHRRPHHADLLMV